MSSDIPSFSRIVISSLAGYNLTNFRVGGTLVVFPLELLKSRMQVSGERGSPKDHNTMVQFASHIYKTEGFVGLYSGISASIFRHLTYTGTRLGTYEIMVDHYTVNGQKPPFSTKVGIGIVSGAVAAVVGLPADVSMIRMQVDSRQPPEKKRNYKHVIDALNRIVKEEGLSGLTRGALPTIYRAIVVNTVGIVSYMQVKEVAVKKNIMKDGFLLHTLSSIFSAFVTTVASLPFDIAKTRIQNMQVIKGKPEYNGILDVWKVTIKTEGFLALWKGFTPYFVKNGPQSIVFFVLYEKLCELYRFMQQNKTN